jgi:ATP-binding cassette subfamily B protein
MSSEIQESLSNFKVIVAFNRRITFETNSTKPMNETSHPPWTPVWRAISSCQFMACRESGQVLVIGYGFIWSQRGPFRSSADRVRAVPEQFYMPLRQLAAMWAQLQLALAAVDRFRGSRAGTEYAVMAAVPAAAARC